MAGPATGRGLRLAVIGGGWAGLAAAVEATTLGAQVTLLEMAPQLGGRARSLATNGAALDNGQHILIGAYAETLALMRRVGADPDALLLRQPLRLRYPEHETLQLPPGPPTLAFARAVLACQAWPLAARLGLLATSLGWTLRGFRCDPSLSVAQLCAGLAPAVRTDLIDPLCVAALNTPSPQASAQVFLRVLKDALFSGPGSADLLLPRQGLSALLPAPARDWLQQQGATLRTQRVQHLQSGQVDGEAFDAIVLAASSVEAARLTQDLAPAWSSVAGALRFEPIITVYLHSPGSRLPAPMVALRESAEEPAQFAFDLGQIGQHGSQQDGQQHEQQDGLFSLVISGAAPWVARGLDATGSAALAQALRVLPWAGQPPRILRVLSEKRATFACTPGLQRPAAAVEPGLWAAGDYLQGPYPATLEGAVRSGLAAARSALRQA